ncbi:predicted protein, partial [Nematostella vectensis]
ENYVEYSRTGKIVKGQDKAVAKSKYEEDVYINNHTSVWGSYWENGSWGYDCCYSIVKNSFCTGEAGKASYGKGVGMPMTTAAQTIQEAEDSGKSLLEMHQENRKKGKKRDHKADDDEDDEETKRIKLKKALRAEEKQQRQAEQLLAMDERSRPYNSLRGDTKEVTEEEMEAYRMRRRQGDDPMKDFL